MSAHEIISEIKRLPAAERAKIASFLLREDDSWIPDDFKAAMKDMEAGRLLDTEIAMDESIPLARNDGVKMTSEEVAGRL